MGRFGVSSSLFGRRRHWSALTDMNRQKCHRAAAPLARPQPFAKYCFSKTKRSLQAQRLPALVNGGATRTQCNPTGDPTHVALFLMFAEVYAPGA